MVDSVDLQMDTASLNTPEGSSCFQHYLSLLDLDCYACQKTKTGLRGSMNN
jgi:hypothetical protein